MEPPEDPNQRQFHWDCTVSVPGGGLQVTTDEFPFKAPEGGYVEAIDIRIGIEIRSLVRQSEGVLT